MKLIKGGATTVTGVLQYYPELRYTPTGKCICTFTVSNLQTLEPLNCEAWEEIGEVIIDADLKPQSIVSLTGYTKVREHEGKKHSYFVVKTWKWEMPF